MTPLFIWPNPSKLAWLELVIRERFGQPFRLRSSCPDTLCLYLDGDDRSIEAPVCGAFSRPPDQLPCSFWEAATEGWSGALSGALPAPGAIEIAPPLIKQLDRGYRIDYDIFGLACWMLSRQEELNRTEVDQFQRFQAEASHPRRHGYLQRPVVDEWLHILGQVIARTWPGLALKRHEFAIHVSHDVDRPARYAFCPPGRLLRAMVSDLVKWNQASSLLAPIVRLNSRTQLHPADPFNTFGWIMDLSERVGLRSAFYFICGRTDQSKDADYEIEHPAIRSLVREIGSRGHEIGLHPSFNSYLNPAAIVSELARLRNVCAEEGVCQSVWGARMHYLRWSHPATLRACERAGISYDTTLGYPDAPGFRCGTCFEYPAFDPVRDEVVSLRIRPLIAMECAAVTPGSISSDLEIAAMRELTELKQACKSVLGSFSLLWHNSNLRTPADRRMYEAILSV